MREETNRGGIRARRNVTGPRLRLAIDPPDSIVELNSEALAAAAANFERLEQAQEELANARFRMRAIFDAGGDEYLFIGPNGRIADVNDTVLSALGKGRSECIGHDYRTIIANEDYRDTAERALRRRRPVQIETRSAFHPTRSIRLTAIADDDGLTLYGRDIGEMPGLNGEDDARDALLHGLVDSVTDHVLVLDSRGTVVLASATPCTSDEGCGLDPVMATGEHYRTIIGTCFGDYSDVVAAVERMLTGKAFEYRGVLPVGAGAKKLPAEVHAVRLADPHFHVILSWRLRDRAEPANGGSRPVLMARDDERRRLARELHDSVQQDLAAVELGLQILSRQDKGDASSDIVAELKTLVSRTQLDVRTTTYLMHPPEIGDGNFVSALERMLEGLGRRTKLKVDFHMADKGWKFHDALAGALYRITQEAMMNVYRHSQATRAIVRLSPGTRQVVLDIEDNGVGFDPAAALDSAAGVGIQSMVARAQEQGGSLSIERLDRGTLVRATLPNGRRRSDRMND